MAASALSLCALAPKPSHNPTPLDFPFSRTNLSLLSHAFSSPKLSSRHNHASSFIAKATDTDAPVVLVATDTPVLETESSVEVSKPKHEEVFAVVQVLQKEGRSCSMLTLTRVDGVSCNLSVNEETQRVGPLSFISTVLCSFPWLAPVQVAQASEGTSGNVVFEVAELFELGIQLSYLLLLLALLGVGTFFVIRQVLVRRELDLSAKELQEQVRSGDASATGLFELGAVMLRRKFYPAATKYLLQAIEKWDGDDQDLAQVHNALGVTYARDGKVDKSITEFETAVKLQPGYVTAWNNLGDAYEKINNLKSALRAFEEVLLLDPNNTVARPRRDALKDKVDMYKGVPVKSKKKLS